ncbi:sigma-70 family RNA polymerase sigma factor [Spirosoma sp. HMF3257]|uniref:RNA polymerase subunit sigma-70 n=1 Tax=Spirosoma telluris TaxID=2183553 RepID=A0A327NMY6_9BACT|nr:sigma-70 family RNA polymerase sigma factor [Spirosoma telluris]RAI75749.1 RNA polymerase subunit sigma-70 [Spirosoma telluris]
MTERPLADILKDCRRGREAAMQAFYERFYSYALSVCLAYASDREDAREMLNDGFLKAFRHVGDLKNEAVVIPWLRRIMVNTAIDYYRRNRKRALDTSTELVEYSLQEPYLNDEAIFSQLSVEHILTVLHQLPTPYRMVFSLYVLEGYTHREIADQLGIAESTSRAHLSEANRLLRRALTTQIPTDHERTNR